MPSFIESLAQSTAARSLAASALPATPKRRAAVVVHDGYAAADAWVRAKPTVFYSGIAVALLSAFLGYKRRNRGAEAWGVYAAGVVAGVGVAWVARPGAEGAVSPGAAPGSSQGSAVDRVMALLDARARTLDRQEPGWEDVAIRRVTG